MALAATAHAAFPGANGKIAFSHSAGGPSQVYTMNSDGSGRTPLTAGPGRNIEPAWSPDGTKIAFMSNRDDPNPGGCGSGCNYEIYVMDANGANQTRLTTDPAADGSPAWSPDGTKIVFDSARTADGDIYSMNVDGTGVVRLTTRQFPDEDPSWSPDGTKIVFLLDGGFLALMNPDGSNQARVPTDDSEGERFFPDWSPDARTIAFQELPCCDSTDTTQQVGTIHPDGTGLTVLGFRMTAPAWSPDGSRLAIGEQRCDIVGGLTFCFDKDIITTNPDGTGRVNLTNNPSGANSGQPSWQPIPQNYVRPRGATPLLASLVPAYKPCTAPNDTHGAPLSFSSCDPPQPASSHLTVGTPDANGQGANAIGSLRMKTFLCPACASPMPHADVRLDVSITDVRNTDAGLSDYTGQLRADAALRITDRQNTPNPGGPGPGTVSDTRFPFAVPCTATPDPAVGSTCSVSTTANAVVGGSVVADQRTIWQLGQIQVYDGGASGVAGASDATLFMNQGVFVP